MAKTYADLFGKPAAAGGGKSYIKWDKVGDVLAFVVTGEPVSDQPQKDFGTGKNKWMTRATDSSPWKALAEGSFDPDEMDSAFQLFEIMIPVTVAAKAEGKEPVADWAPFDAEWTFKGDQEAKFKDALLEFDAPIGVGTVIQVKYLAEGKPRKYAIKIKAGE